MLYDGGAVYDGEFEADRRQGQGKMTYDDGNGVVYQGQWMADKRHGEGRMLWLDSTATPPAPPPPAAEGADPPAEGADPKAAAKAPPGPAPNPSALVYEGAWVQDKKHGKGKVKHSAGGKFQGTFYNDAPR
jgi:hypothetical protein